MARTKYQYMNGQSRGGTPGGATNTRWNGPHSLHHAPKRYDGRSPATVANPSLALTRLNRDILNSIIRTS